MYAEKNITTQSNNNLIIEILGEKGIMIRIFHTGTALVSNSFNFN